MGRDRSLVISADAAARLAAAAEWLDAYPRDAEVLVVASSWEACDELVRAAARRAGARFGVVRLTLDRLAARLAAPALARAGCAPASPLSLEAVAARAVHLSREEGALSYFQPVAAQPGFPRAVARTLSELRMNGAGADSLRALPFGGPDLAVLAARVEAELARACLADRAATYAAACDAVESTGLAPVGFPILLLDLPIAAAREAELIADLALRSPRVLAIAPAGDERAISLLAKALGTAPERLAEPPAAHSLATLKTHLFADSAPASSRLDESVTLGAWPGEARECVEIARAIQAEAARDVPFDEIAVLLHAPGDYTAHLEEALRRADLPAFFARGTTRPHPAGRALLALLACAGEGLSARRFAEYLSLAQVPDPERSPDPDRGWSPPENDLLPTLEAAPARPPPEILPSDPASAPVLEGSLRAPWRWERLIVDAAVIGGRERWERRLSGLAEELRLHRAELQSEEEARIAHCERSQQDLAHLRHFALPLLDRLAALPRRALWGEWLEHLRTLAAAALREPEAVLATLAELFPMAPVGPVELDEVQLVLRPRLRELPAPPPRRRYGAVFVAPTEMARGLAFRVVFVPGLAEKIFPRKIVEDPVLLDGARQRLELPGLALQPSRAAAERLALQIAVGAARERVHLSYPRLDIEQARPRVPSFYALEALRAAEGSLPGFDELGERAVRSSQSRLGWPAPERPEDALDEAEYDLALLGPRLSREPMAGVATYLLGANAHLARALRARARRWLRRWTAADGLVDPDDLGRAALAGHAFSARSFSPTALQNYAVCPYRFFLQAIHRLEPLEDPVALETIDPLTRGALFHAVQFEILTRLRDEGRLPLRRDSIEEVLSVVDGALTRIADEFRDELAPAIPRVWEDGIQSVRADLREWLRRVAESTDGFVPHHFELAFGLAGRGRGQEDPASRPGPVTILGDLQLRGSIDLVERHRSGLLRATDHKTGKVYAEAGVVVGKGEILQPVLYALACEALTGAQVASGRLYYCTADGGFAEREVPLEAASRKAAGEVVQVIGKALHEGFFPAAPREGGCRYCDYRPVCGPYEETRWSRKPLDRLADLLRLRSMP
jgi:RecB family exonuclease